MMMCVNEIYMGDASIKLSHLRAALCVDHQLTFVAKVEQTPIKANMVERLEESNRWVLCVVLSLVLFVSSFLVGFS